MNASTGEALWKSRRHAKEFQHSPIVTSPSSLASRWPVFTSSADCSRAHLHQNICSDQSTFMTWEDHQTSVTHARVFAHLEPSVTSSLLRHQHWPRIPGFARSRCGAFGVRTPSTALPKDFLVWSSNANRKTVSFTFSVAIMQFQTLTSST